MYVQDNMKWFRLFSQRLLGNILICIGLELLYDEIKYRRFVSTSVSNDTRLRKMRKNIDKPCHILLQIFKL